jgi:hypothetical protein
VNVCSAPEVGQFSLLSILSDLAFCVRFQSIGYSWVQRKASRGPLLGAAERIVGLRLAFCWLLLGFSDNEGPRYGYNVGLDVCEAVARAHNPGKVSRLGWNWAI